MVTSKPFRCWLLGLCCSVFPFAGCAHTSKDSSGGLLSWFRSAPLSEQEQQSQQREEASSRLQDPANLHLKYAQWRENVGDLADARQSYQFALKENPKSMDAKLGLARLDQASGRTEEAEREFQAVLSSHPGNPQAKNALGQFYASQKQWGKAVPLLAEAADEAPAESIYRYHLAVAMAQSGDVDGAFPHFRLALGEAEAHYNIGYLLYERGYQDLAKQRFLKALELNPKLAQAQAMLDEMAHPAKDAVLAETAKPSMRESATPAIQQTAAQVPPRTAVQTADFQAPATAWPGVKSPSNPPRLMPSHPVKTQATETYSPRSISRRQSFQATNPEHHRAGESPQSASEYLPPYEPQANFRGNSREPGGIGPPHHGGPTGAMGKPNESRQEAVIGACRFFPCRDGLL